jgi:hypothetical protein
MSKCYKNGNQLLTYRRYRMRHRWKRERAAAERRGDRESDGSRQSAETRDSERERASTRAGPASRCQAGLREEEERAAARS